MASLESGKKEQMESLLKQIRQWWNGLGQEWPSADQKSLLLYLLMNLKLARPELFCRLDPGFERGLDSLPPELMPLCRLYCDLVLQVKIGRGLEVTKISGLNCSGEVAKIVSPASPAVPEGQIFSLEIPCGWIDFTRSFLDGLKREGDWFKIIK